MNADCQLVDFEKLPIRLWAGDGLKHSRSSTATRCSKTSNPPLGGRWIETGSNIIFLINAGNLPIRLWAGDGLKLQWFLTLEKITDLPIRLWAGDGLKPRSDSNYKQLPGCLPIRLWAGDGLKQKVKTSAAEMLALLPIRLWAGDGLKRSSTIANMRVILSSNPPLGGRWIETQDVLNLLEGYGGFQSAFGREMD